MFTTKELFQFYSAGIMSMQVMMVISGISTKREFIKTVERHQLPFAIYLPDARAMMTGEKDEFIRRYCCGVQ